MQNAAKVQAQHKYVAKNQAQHKVLLKVGSLMSQPIKVQANVGE